MDNSDSVSEYENRAKIRVEEALKRSLEVRRIEIITDSQYLEKFDVGENDGLMYVKTAPISKLTVIDTPEVLYSFIVEELFDVDAIVVESEFPPEGRVNKCPIFYVKVAL